MEIPFIGPSYCLETREAGVQRTVNLIPTPQEPGNERTAWVFEDTPGRVLLNNFSGVTGEGQGLVTFQGLMYGVRGGVLYRFDAAGAATTIGSIGGSGIAEFAQTRAQLGIANGSSLWVYDGTTLQTAGGYVPGTSIAVIDQRLFYTRYNSEVFGYSDLNDMLTIQADSFYSAERKPDDLKAMVEVYGELLMLGQYSGEIWTGVGGTEVVQRNNSAYIEFGTDAPHTVRKCVGGSCIWLGRSERGQTGVLQLQGYQAKFISTRTIEERFDGVDTSMASAYVRLDGKRESYYLNCPGLDTTLVYDATFKQWHEEAELVNGEYAQGAAVCSTFAYGAHYVLDALGSLYKLSHDVNDFAGAVKCRDRISPVVANPAFKPMKFPYFEMLCKRATDGVVLLRYSDDNGATWSNWHYSSTGEVGAYRTRIRFERLGRARDRVYHARMTDASRWDPVTVDVGVNLR